MASAIIQFHPLGADAAVRFVHAQHIGTHTFPSHAHRSFSLGLVEKGRRLIHANGETVSISAGEGFVLNPQQSHRCQVVGPEEHAYWVVSIQPAHLHSLYTQATGRSGFPRFRQVRLADVPLLARLAAWLEAPSAGEEALNSLLRDLVVGHAQEGVTPPPACPHIVESTRQQLEAHSEASISLHELAETAHLSPFYLTRIFRRATGVPPYTYLLQSRIKKSLEVLRQTGSIVLTAQELGFADQSHFTRVFKREVGITPGRFLDLHKAEEG